MSACATRVLVPRNGPQLVEHLRQLAFLMEGLDKNKANRKMFRLPESRVEGSVKITVCIFCFRSAPGNNDCVKVPGMY